MTRILLACVFSLLFIACNACATSAAEVPKRIYELKADEFFPATCSAHWDELSRPIIIVFNDPKLRLFLSEAARVWNEKLGFEIFRVIEVERIPVYPFGRIVPVFFGSEKIDPSHVAETNFALGRECDFLYAFIQIRADASPDVLYNVIIHEFGHVLGLIHSDNPRDVMFHAAHPGPVIIDPAAVDELKALYGKD